MRIPVLVVATLLAAAPALVATPPQASSNAKATAQILNPPDSGCPVNFSARRQSLSEVVEVGRSQQHRSGQGVHLSVQHPPTAVTAAEVVVHAYSNNMRFLPVQETGPESQTDHIARSYHLSASAKGGGLHTSDLWVEDAGSIFAVDLVSVTYADGSVWKHNTCRALVSGYLLVSSR